MRGGGGGFDPITGISGDGASVCGCEAGHGKEAVLWSHELGPEGLGGCSGGKAFGVLMVAVVPRKKILYSTLLHPHE